MTAVPTYFSEFLTNIRPTLNQRTEMKDGHNRLQERLRAYDNLNDKYVGIFLQGSYRRSTVVKPTCGERSDVDIVIVTKFHESEFDPDLAQKQFHPFLEQHYKGKWKSQGRSLGIEMSNVDLDLVITSAPSETMEGLLKSDAVNDIGDVINSGIYPWTLRKSWQRLESINESRTKAIQTEPEWKTEPLRIPDRDSGKWDDTDPLKQMRWTTDKNKACNTHFVNVVKCVKWWRRSNSNLPKRPKGYHIERIVAEVCPDGIESVAEGVVATFEGIVTRFATDRRNVSTPHLPDIGIDRNNVFERIEGKDFAMFYDAVSEAAKLARSAFNSDNINDSVTLWRKLFGSEFPNPRNGGSDGKVNSGFSERTEKSTIGGSGRFG